MTLVAADALSDRIHPVRGQRVMLTWVGKKPLAHPLANGLHDKVKP
ncbi:MAG: hypothetical protein KGZ43_04650 [Sulfuritalea sp.]|nr:hypothetical protein [Sulfuritalea sp.]